MIKDIFERQIQRGKFDLDSITERLNEYHIRGDLTMQERDDLLVMAQENASQSMDAKAEIAMLWEAVNALRDALDKGSSGAAGSTQEYVPFVKPSGFGSAYRLGAKVTYKGQRYTSLRAFNLWAPDVNPLAWKWDGSESAADGDDV